MVSQLQSANDRMRTNWSTEMERYFLDLLLYHKGNRMGYTFSKQAWSEMLTMFQANFGSLFDMNFLKSRYTTLWTRYNEAKSLLEHSRFSWDDSEQMVIASNDVWDTYIQAHPSAESYRNKPLSNFNDLCLIYAHTTADGRYSLSSHDVDFDDVVQRINTGEKNSSYYYASSELLRGNWTLQMDCYFSDLLLDQALKGNKIGQEFTTQAWTEMVRLFTEKFAGCTGTTLINRSNYLRRQYHDINYLLKQHGFCWDEKQEMLMAEDDAWSSYAKVCPRSLSYRNRVIPGYHKLCVIYDQETSGERCGPSACSSGYNGNCPISITEGDYTEDHDIDDFVREDWTPSMERFFIDLILEEVRRGIKIEYACNKETWIHMVMLFKDKFAVEIDKDFLKGCYKDLRMLYISIKNLLDQRGFWWDETQQMVTAYAHIWDAYVKDHPDAKIYRGKRVPNYNDLSLIYGDSDSNEGRNLGSQDISCNGGGSISNDCQWRFDGNPAMDRHFMDLMLQQVHNGSMIDNKFDKLAWRDMVAKFRAEFGPQYNKDFLKSRFIILKKRFEDMKALLDQNGFTWNEMQQMVIPQSDLRDVFVQDHSDARSYSGSTHPNFSDLRLIFGNSHFCANQDFSTEVTDGKGEDEVAFDLEGSGQDYDYASKDSLRIPWSTGMDRYLIDLLLEQMRRGNKIGLTFTEKAWTRIPASFNCRFGLLCDKDVFQERYLNLLKVYGNIADFLYSKCIAWEEVQYTVEAKNAWTAYFEMHPDDITYAESMLHNFGNLCALYADQHETSRRSSDVGLELEVGNHYFGSTAEGVYGNMQLPLRELGTSPASRKRKSEVPTKTYKIHRTFKNDAQPEFQKPKEVNMSIRKEEEKDGISIETIVTALQTIPHIDDELFLEACKHLEDDRKAKMFVAMDATARWKWLTKELDR